MEIHTPGQIFRNTPYDKFILNLSCSQAKLENDNKGVDVKRGLRKKIAAGMTIGLVPEGYVNSKYAARGTNVALKDSERFPLVRKMWDLMLTGNYTPQQILKIANREWGYKTIQRHKIGGKSLSRSAIYQMFKNPFYYGSIFLRKADEVHPGTHEPMVTKEEFDRVQFLLRSKGLKSAPHTKEFAHTGQIVCQECGCQITAEEKNKFVCTNCKQKFTHSFKGNKAACPYCGTLIANMEKPKSYHYVHYRCTKRKNTETFRCSQSSVSEKDLEGQVKNFLATISINPKYLEWGLKHLNENKPKEAVTEEAIAQNAEKALAGIEKKLGGLIDMRAAGEISEEEFSKRRQAALNEKELMETILKKNKRDDSQGTNKAKETLTFAERALREYENGDKRKKHEILKTLSSELKLNNKTLLIHAQKPSIILTQSLVAVPEAKAGLGTVEPTINKRRTASFDVVRPSWLGSWDSNPEPID